MPKLERVYRHYLDLEEYHAGMWRVLQGAERAEFVATAADLLRDLGRFRDALAEMLAAWPVSASVALSAESTNRIAWLGQAACCFAVQAPEECVRVAWHTLSPTEQDRANASARDALVDWESTQVWTLFGEVARAA